jgi:hypothetical protein
VLSPPCWTGARTGPQGKETHQRKESSVGCGSAGKGVKEVVVTAGRASPRPTSWWWRKQRSTCQCGSSACATKDWQPEREQGLIEDMSGDSELCKSVKQLRLSGRLLTEPRQHQFIILFSLCLFGVTVLYRHSVVITVQQLP